MIFLRHFGRLTAYVREVLLGLVGLMILGGVLIARVEEMPFGEAMYFVAITGLTIGYGDITPETPPGKVLSVFIGLVGLVMVGMLVAISNRALALTVEHVDGGTPEAKEIQQLSGREGAP